MQDQKEDDHRDSSPESQLYPWLHQKNHDQHVEESAGHDSLNSTLVQLGYYVQLCYYPNIRMWTCWSKSKRGP